MHKLPPLDFGAAEINGGLVFGVDVGCGLHEAAVDRGVEGSAEGFSCAVDSGCCGFEVC